MQTCRSSHTATLLPSGLVLVVGGWDISCAGYEVQTISSSVGELYNPATGTFSQTGQASIRRYSHTATMLPNGKVLIAGGDSPDTGYTPLATAELYDPSSGTFTPTGSMTVSRAGHTATALPNGKVMIVGGVGAVGTQQGDDGPITVYAVLSTAELYDPNTGKFSVFGSMAAPRQNQKALMLWNGKVFVAGGSNSNNFALATAEVSH